MQDSVAVLMQHQFQLMIASAIKSVFIWLFFPIIVMITGGLVIQFFVGRKSFKSFIEGLKDQINNKVGYKKFDESITRAHNERKNGDKEIHERLNTHIDEDNKIRNKMSGDIEYIRGRIESFLKNGGSQSHATGG